MSFRNERRAFINEHTPGPWLFEGGKIYSPIQRTEYASSTTIALTWDETTESHANARLMAAAPDLYKELTILSNLLQCADKSFWKKEIESIESVLKKARGAS